MTESIKNKAIKGAGWSFADSLFNQGITFLVGLVLARLLTPEEYGLIGIIMIFIAVFNSVVDSGFSSALIRKNDVTDEDYNTVFLTNMLISIVLCIVMFSASSSIASYFDQSQLEPLTKVMSFVLIINAFAIIQRTILVKNVDFKTQTKISLVASLVSGCVGIGMALSDFGVWSLVGQQLSRQSLNTLLLWIYAKWYPKLRFSIKSFKELFGFGWKLMLSGLIDTVWKEIYQVVIGKCYSTDTLGQYTRAHQFSSIFSTNLTNIVQRVSYPILSQIQDNKATLKAGYKKVIKVAMFASFCCMLGLAASARSFIITLVGVQWLPSVQYLQIICLQMMLYPLHAINLNMLQLQGRSDIFLKLEIIKKIIAVGPLLLGVFMNIYWMLCGSVCVGVISYFLNAYYSGRSINYSIAEQVRDIMPSFFVALAMAVVLYALSLIRISPPMMLLLQISVGLLFVVTVSELLRIDAYMELKSIFLSYLNKFRNGK